MEKQSKNTRTLDMYARLCEGKIINKADEARKFGVDERSIQRDIDDIRAFLDDRRADKANDNRTIIYDRAKKGFIMDGAEASMMSNSEILAVSKILLESRAFTKREMNSILDKLVEGCVPLKNMKLVTELISNEKYHYIELDHREYIQDKLWQIGMDINGHNLIAIKYSRANAPRESIKRIVEPLGLIFSEYYFYLNAYVVEKDETGKYVHKYSHPTIFRLDRIKNYKTLDEKFKVSYANRFEEGEFRKRTQFMFPGRLINVRMKYFGTNPDHILDRLPTAHVVEKYENECIIEADVFGYGIIMWLLSQKNSIEVLKPDELREDMKKTLKDMLKLYE